MRSPTTLDRLDDYLSGEMSAADADGFEEELFADGGPPSEVAFADALARLGAYLDRHGTYHPGSTRAHIASLEAAGYRVAWSHTRPGEHNVVPLPPPDVDFTVTRLDVDLRGVAGSIDVEIEVIGHGVLKTFRDVGVDPEDGALYALCERDLATIAAQVGTTRGTVVTERDGKREVLAVFEVSPGT